MIDWPVVLSALVLLPVVALLYFVGCGTLTPAPDDPGEPDTTPPATPTAPPPSPKVTLPPTGPPTVPPPTPTRLVLKLAPNLNVIPMGAVNDQVESVVASWTLQKKVGQPSPDPDDLPLDEAIVRVDGPPRLFLDPALDPPAIRILTTDQVTTYGNVKWTATVVTKAAAGGGGRPDSVTGPANADVSVDSAITYRLDPDWTTPGAIPRRFTLTAESPTPAPPSPNMVTRLQLNPAPNINDIIAGGRSYKVFSIQVEWTLSKSTGGRPNQVLHETIVRKDSSRPFLDPKLDQPAIWELSPDPDPATGFNLVTCGCVVTTKPTAGGGGPETTTLVSSPVAFKAGVPNVFVLYADWEFPAIAPRRFTIVLQG